MPLSDDLSEYIGEQLELANRSDSEIRAVLDVFEALTIDWPDVDPKWALDTVRTFLDGTSVELPDQHVEDDLKWAPILLGDGTRPGHVVRVKPDAYTAGAHADEHNARVGKFAGARNGYVYVKYDDETTDNQGNPHRPELVEKLVSQM